jgi:hypothetical protein
MYTKEAAKQLGILGRLHTVYNRILEVGRYRKPRKAYVLLMKVLNRHGKESAQEILSSAYFRGEYDRLVRLYNYAREESEPTFDDLSAYADGKRKRLVEKQTKMN